MNEKGEGRREKGWTLHAGPTRTQRGRDVIPSCRHGRVGNTAANCIEHQAGLIGRMKGFPNYPNSRHSAADSFLLRYASEKTSSCWQQPTKTSNCQMTSNQ